MKSFCLIAAAAVLVLGAMPGVRAGTDGVGVHFDMQLEVNANEIKGAGFTVPETGEYTFTVQSGAFCYLPDAAADSPYAGWLTQLEIHTAAVEWGMKDEWGTHPLGADGNAGVPTHQPTREAAAAAGRGVMSTMHLEKGIRVTLLVSDGSDYYKDNLGSMKIRVTAGVPPEALAVLPEPEVKTVEKKPLPEPEVKAVPKALPSKGVPAEPGKPTIMRLDSELP